MVQNVRDQYKDSKNLESRISIYQFSQNPETLYKWISRHIEPQSDAKILELGCGTGALWQSLREQTQNCEIHLTDLSQGMLDKAQSLLGSEDFSYGITDFHNIGFADNSFDCVISNHNLYHAEDLNRVLSEIQRVLKPGGRFYATTNADEHLMEIRYLLNIDDDALWPNFVITRVFGEESGMRALSNHFTDVRLQRYRNELHVPEFDHIKNYLLSVRDDRIHSIVRDNEAAVKDRFETQIRETGFFRIRSEACLFSCKA